MSCIRQDAQPHSDLEKNKLKKVRLSGMGGRCSENICSHTATVTHGSFRDSSVTKRFYDGVPEAVMSKDSHVNLQFLAEQNGQRQATKRALLEFGTSYFPWYGLAQQPAAGLGVPLCRVPVLSKSEDMHRI